MSKKNRELTESCRGLFFRCSVNLFISSHGSIEERKSLRILKKKSCSGCEKCKWEMETFSEDLYFLCDLLKDVENGEIYKLEVIISPGTYEYPDDIDIEFHFIKQVE